MRFVVDEYTGSTVARWLMDEGHDVYSVSLSSPGWKDSDILAKANAEKRIVITNDRDFGELIFKNRLPHRGVIFLRLSDETSLNKIAVLMRLFLSHGISLDYETFLTVTEESVRLRKSL